MTPTQRHQKTIAIIGASNDRTKFGNKAVRAFVSQGWRVFPVHPREATIEGLTAYARITDVPERPNRVSVYVPPKVLMGLLPEIAARGTDELWLNPGTESPEVIERADHLGIEVVQACSIVAVGVAPDTI